MSNLQWTDFPGRNKNLGAPPDWDEEDQGTCGVLPVYADGQICTSCWQPNWRQRVAILFGQPIWLEVVFGATQPPVMLKVQPHNALVDKT